MKLTPYGLWPWAARAAWLVVPVGMLATAAPARAAGRTVADEEADRVAIGRIAPVRTRDLCARLPGRKHCMAKVVTGEDGSIVRPLAGAAPQGLSPSDLHAAYSLPMTGGGGRTVALIDAFDAPNAESDLATYRSQFGLPPCTSASGCFTKVDQNGGTDYPPTDGQGTSGWEGEIMLDIEMVSAVCPDCKILLVEAPSDSSSFAASLATAGRLGASAISNSYGSNEDSSVSQQETAYDQPALVTASAGDSGYAAEYPATSAYVLAIGGTSLATSGSTRGWAETTWAYKNGGGTGSGCSGFISKPSYQKDTACANRMESDVSAVADPATGVATYDQGWEVVGGTSAASPIVAATFTLLGLEKAGLSFPYKNPQAFNDITSGTNDPGKAGNGGAATPTSASPAPATTGPPAGGRSNGDFGRSRRSSATSSGSDAESPHDDARRGLSRGRGTGSSGSGSSVAGAPDRAAARDPGVEAAGTGRAPVDRAPAPGEVSRAAPDRRAGRTDRADSKADPGAASRRAAVERTRGSGELENGYGGGFRIAGAGVADRRAASRRRDPRPAEGSREIAALCALGALSQAAGGVRAARLHGGARNRVPERP